MANYAYNRKTVDKLSVKGVLSEDLDVITCDGKDGDQFDVSIQECLEHFAEQNITFTLTLNKDEDLLNKEG